MLGWVEVRSAAPEAAGSSCWNTLRPGTTQQNKCGRHICWLLMMKYASIGQVGLSLARRTSQRCQSEHEEARPQVGISEGRAITQWTPRRKLAGA